MAAAVERCSEKADGALVMVALGIGMCAAFMCLDLGEGQLDLAEYGAPGSKHTGLDAGTAQAQHGHGRGARPGRIRISHSGILSMPHVYTHG